jgi:hypothetical protein
MSRPEHPLRGTPVRIASTHALRKLSPRTHKKHRRGVIVGESRDKTCWRIIFLSSTEIHLIDKRRVDLLVDDVDCDAGSS